MLSRSVRPDGGEVSLATSPMSGSTRTSATRRTSRSASVGCEINFNRYFCRYTPPWSLEEIEADIRGIETDILRMLAEMTGSGPGVGK
jgi:type I restriction enzyme M protein